MKPEINDSLARLTMRVAGRVVVAMAVAVAVLDVSAREFPAAYEGDATSSTHH